MLRNWRTAGVALSLVLAAGCAWSSRPLFGRFRGEPSPYDYAPATNGAPISGGPVFTEVPVMNGAPIMNGAPAVTPIQQGPIGTPIVVPPEATAPLPSTPPLNNPPPPVGPAPRPATPTNPTKNTR